MICFNELVEQIYHHDFCIVDNFLSEETMMSLRSSALQLLANNEFQAAKIGSQTKAFDNQTIRRDKIHWLDESPTNPAITSYFTAMKAIADTLNLHLYLGLMEFETHFSIYQPGSFYKKHVDQFHNKQERKISCVYYLNLDWQDAFGGQLTLYNTNHHRLSSILPIANRLVCFSSSLPHEVCETSETRLSIAGWMKTRAL